MSRAFRQLVIVLIALGMACASAGAGDPKPDPARPGPPWTVNEALGQLALYPRDAYLQYVALQLARRDGEAELKRAAQQIRRQTRRRGPWGRAGRREQVDLFNLTTGALAVQESLQLDAMTAEVGGGFVDRDPSFPRGRQSIFMGSPAEQNNLRQLGIAMHNHHDTQKNFPAAATFDSKGQKLLSWRVHLLPFLDQQNLYRQFHIDEPWDSPHNRALIAKMPKVYRTAGHTHEDQHKTCFLVSLGETTLFPGRKTVSLRQVVDGTSNTIMLVQVAAEHAVVWTKPDDITLDPKTPLSGIAGAKPGWFHVALADGSVRSIPTTVDPDLLRRLFVRDDGQPMNWEAVYARRPPQSTERESADVDITTLTGPTVRSHPFEEMLAGRKPAVSPLAAAVPESFYYIRFRSLSKLLELADSSDLWATHLFSQSTQDAYSHQVKQRVQTQLCVESNNLLRPFYDLVVKEVAVTGSDLFLREGSDVTLLFRYEQEAVFKAQMDGFLANAAKVHPSAIRSTGSYRGVPFVHLATPDRQVHVFSAYPNQGLHVRSNSRVAFERIIDTLIGPASSAPKSTVSKPLSEAFEFRYMRTLYEINAAEEDGFIYLSDAFIRELVGPVRKITERRRVLCYNHMKMLGHAAMLYRTEHGKAPESLDQLITSACLPEDFGAGRLVCPDDGRYHLSEDGTEGICAVHGQAGRMTPCCEISAEHISATERALYQRFLEEYNRYWRTFFDPIGIRVQATPKSYRLETIVLPLIDNSIYTSMAQMLGGTPAPLDSVPVPRRNIFSMAFKFDKDKMIASEAEAARGAELNNLRKIALAFLNHESAFKRFPPHGEKGAKLSWRVHILPFLEQHALYDRFKLDEPWDSPHNIELLKEMPEIYGSEGTMTRIVGFSGDGAPFGKPQGLQMREIADGTSKTILVVEIGRNKAVPWSKPADLPFDPANPIAALGEIPEEGFNAAFMDGSVRRLPKDISAARLKALATYRGGELVAQQPRPPRTRRPRTLIETRMVEGMLRDFGVPKEDIQALGIAEFLMKGIGDQIGFHIYDAEPTFAFSVSQFIGRMVGGRGRGFDDDMMFLVPLVSSLNSPVYLTVPVQDEQIVDQFLDHLDQVLAKAARRPLDSGFFSVETDFYRLPAKGDSVRCFALEFFSFRFRFFVARVDRALVIATQRIILDDLFAQAAADANARHDADRDSVAHMLVRIRPQSWDRVLADYRLGWAESNRESCLKNLGPLSGVARAYGGTGKQTVDAANDLYGVRYFCPEGGHYTVVHSDGTRTIPPNRMHCSIHGSADAPRQAPAPARDSPLDRLLSEFTGLTAALTFTEEGLRAVLRIDRKPTRP